MGEIFILEVFEGFSLEVNLLLENFRESSLRDRRQMTMETLNALSERITSTLKPEEMLEHLVDGIREVIPYDQCAIDAIVKDLKKSDYRFSALVSGIVLSDPFRKRKITGG